MRALGTFRRVAYSSEGSPRKPAKPRKVQRRLGLSLHAHRRAASFRCPPPPSSRPKMPAHMVLLRATSGPRHRHEPCFLWLAQPLAPTHPCGPEARDLPAGPSRLRSLRPLPPPSSASPSPPPRPRTPPPPPAPSAPPPPSTTPPTSPSCHAGVEPSGFPGPRRRARRSAWPPGSPSPPE